MARLMFNQVVNNLAPSRFSSMFQNSNHIHSYNLRGSNSSHSTTIPSMAENISDIVGLKSDHCMLTTVYWTLYTDHSILATIYWSLYADHCILTTVYWPLYTDHCMLTTVYWPLYTDHCILTTLYWPLYTDHYMLTTVYWPLYTGLCVLPTLYWPLYWQFSCLECVRQYSDWPSVHMNEGNWVVKFAFQFMMLFEFQYMFIVELIQQTE
jgi:hypothetical protein